MPPCSQRRRASRRSSSCGSRARLGAFYDGETGRLAGWFVFRELRSGASAVVEGVWGNWCRHAEPAGVRVLLGGGSFVLPVRLRPRCDQPTAATFVAVGTFQRP